MNGINSRQCVILRLSNEWKNEWNVSALENRKISLSICN